MAHCPSCDLLSLKKKKYLLVLLLTREISEHGQSFHSVASRFEVKCDIIEKTSLHALTLFTITCLFFSS
jgi:hypothetical protein